MRLSIITFVCFITSLQSALFFTPQMIAKHLETYTEKEIQLINKDLAVVRSVCFGDAQATKNRFYLATAGGPGSRKTTILEKFVADHPEYQTGVYLDPDPRTLRFMAHTYYAQSLNSLAISQTTDYDQVIKNGYNKWRAGSNYIVLNLFEEAIEAGHSVIYGTTSTGAHIPDFLSALKENGYQIVLLLCSCSDNLRKEAIQYRNQVVRFYQSSPEDAVTKGKLFAQRMGAYFAQADILYFYWSDELFSSETVAAIWQNGKLHIHDPQAMEKFIEKYEADRVLLATEGCDVPSFESFLTNKD